MADLAGFIEFIADLPPGDRLVAFLIPVLLVAWAVMTVAALVARQ